LLPLATGRRLYLQFPVHSSLPSPIIIRPTVLFWHSLAALLQFAGRESATLTAAKMSKGLPPDGVRKMLPLFVRAGILASVFGHDGGYRLAKPLRKISVLEVLEAVDGPLRLDEDDLPAGLTAGSVRTLRQVLDGVAGDVVARLGALKLSEI
jgi:DNA-binding IscR family transcriptional regulator